MKGKNRYNETFTKWIEMKGIIIVIILLIVVAIYFIKWLIFIPYNTYNYMEIGHWGILIGGIGMFIALNIPLGAILIASKADEDEIFTTEVICGVISAIIILVTYAIIYKSIWL